MIQVRKDASRAGVLGVVVAAVIIAAGCAKKPAPVPVTEFQPLADEYFPVKFEHPKGWYVVSEGPRVLVYSSTDAMQKFHDPSASAPPGVELALAYDKEAGAQPLEAVVSAFVDSMKAANYTVSPATPATLDGLQAMKVEYSGNLDRKTQIRRVRVITEKNATLYYAQYSAFNELYDFYGPVRDKMLETFKIQEAQAAAEGSDPSVPSPDMSTFSNNYLSIPYPTNFTATTPTPRGEGKFSLVISGYRQDSNVRVDIFPAKGVTVEKVFEENSPKFPGSRPGGETQISGNKAMVLNWAPMAGVSGRAYFLVKNDQLYRVVVTWAREKQDVYLPVFEKMVQSLQLK